MSQGTQRVLVLDTETPTLRSKVDAYCLDDPELFESWRPIEETYYQEPPIKYETVLEALADGWKLLAPPVKYHCHITNSDNDRVAEAYQWWLVKDNT